MAVVNTPARKAFIPILVVFVLLLCLLAACANGSTGKSTTPASAPTTVTNSANAAAAATAFAYMKLVTIIGRPSVKMLSGTTFEADGQLKNDDTFQHDITLKIVLLDASGKIVGSSTQLVDNVKGGNTVSYSIQGTASQSNWTSVELAVIKVSENLNGAGGD